jgi:hypothetical protein
MAAPKSGRSHCCNFSLHHGKRKFSSYNLLQAGRNGLLPPFFDELLSYVQRPEQLQGLQSATGPEPCFSHEGPYICAVCLLE